jgi:hypothetical protein
LRVVDAFEFEERGAGVGVALSVWMLGVVQVMRWEEFTLAGRKCAFPYDVVVSLRDL